MPTLRERWRSFRGPSRAELATTVANLQTELQQHRFKRFNPVASGVPINWNQFEYEQNDKLNSTERWDTYERLALDPHVREALDQGVYALMNGDWEIEPASDAPRDVEIAEFVAANLLRESSDRFGPEYFSRDGWKAQRLRDVLLMREYGFSAFSKVTKIVNGKRIFDRFVWLEPASIAPNGWVLDDQGNFIEFKRTYQTPSGMYHFWETLPAEQIILYVWDLRGERYQGRPFTRPMYGAWTRKEFKQKQSAILSQKLGSPVPYGFWPPGFPDSELSKFNRFIKSLRGTASAEAYFAGPMGNDGTPPQIGYVGADHNVDRGFTDIIDAENREIGHAGSSTMSNLGEGQTGSRALGESKGLSEMVSVEALVKIVCEFEAHGMANLPGPIEELVDWNYAGVKHYPRLVASRVNPFALARAWEDTITAWEKGIIPKTPEARRQIVETNLGLNLPDDQYEQAVEPPLPLQPGATSGTPSRPPSGDDSEDAAEVPQTARMESIDQFRARIASLLEPMEDAPKGGSFRGRNRLEVQVVNIALVQDSFRVGERDFLIELRATHRAMIDELMGRFRDGKITPRNIESQRRSAFRGARKAKNAIVEVARRVGATGWSAVTDEIEVQRA